MMDIIKALEMLKKLENKIRELYTFYHEMFCDDKTAAGFFFELSLEEKSHADLIDYQIRTIRKNRSLFADVEVDTERLDKFIADIDAKIMAIQTVSLCAAIKFSIELENDSVEYQYRTLIAEANPEMADLLNKLGTSDKEHVDKLKILAKNAGCAD